MTLAPARRVAGRSGGAHARPTGRPEAAPERCKRPGRRPSVSARSPTTVASGHEATSGTGAIPSEGDRRFEIEPVAATSGAPAPSTWRMPPWRRRRRARAGRWRGNSATACCGIGRGVPGGRPWPGGRARGRGSSGRRDCRATRRGRAARPRRDATCASSSWSAARGSASPAASTGWWRPRPVCQLHLVGAAGPARDRSGRPGWPPTRHRPRTGGAPGRCRWLQRPMRRLARSP